MPLFLLTVRGVFTKQLSARWAIVQLAGRRILVPLIVVQVHVAQPTRTQTSPSSSRPRTAAFHAVNSGSNPLGDAKIRYNKGYQCAKHIGILSFFVSTGFPVVHVCPVASNSCRGISEGRSMLCKSVIPSRITRLYCCIFCPERYRNIQQKPGSTPCLLPTFVSAV